MGKDVEWEKNENSNSRGHHVPVQQTNNTVKGCLLDIFFIVFFLV